jgi:hypothetical protein
MKRIYEWITKANQVLLFFAILVGMTLVLYTIYQATRRYEPPHVSVAQTSEEAKKSEVQDVVFLGQTSSVYVLGIVKRVVMPGGEPWLRPSMSYLGKGGSDTGETVNVIFSKGDQRVRALLPKDGLVLSHNAYTVLAPPGERAPDKFKSLLFLCATEDTDGNHRLDQNDRNDLYVIPEGLEKPDIVVQGVLDHRTISSTHLMVKTGESQAVRFWDIDIETQARKEVIWK